jgi:hypothetical protein
MKTCPWCGRNNLDSDDYCFNCENDLNAVPDEDESVELDFELRKTRVVKSPSLLRLVLVSLLRKVLLALLALGAVFIFVLIAMKVSYDNNGVAIAALAFMGAVLLAALYYPDMRISRKVGNKGILISVIANLILLAMVVPPTLYFLSSRGYIGDVWNVVGKLWWTVPAYLLLGCAIAWLAGRRAAVEAAQP